MHYINSRTYVIILLAGLNFNLKQATVRLSCIYLMKGNVMEIERKYLIKNIPFSVGAFEHHEISQGYISTSPVIRVRKNDDEYILTIKGKGLTMREEHELFITAEEYESLTEKVSGNLIEKTRYLIPDKCFGKPDSTLTIELDIFHGCFEGLIYAEVEFPDEDSMKKYNPPAFMDREVSDDFLYSNASLSTMDSAATEAFMRALHSNQDLQ